MTPKLFSPLLVSIVHHREDHETDVQYLPEGRETMSVFLFLDCMSLMSQECDASAMQISLR